MKRQLYPQINFAAYRKAKYLLACYSEWGRGVVFNGIRFKREACPLCSSSDSRSRCFSWSFQTCSFYCHKCKARGDALELVCLKLGYSKVAAAKWLDVNAGPSDSGVVVAG